MFALVPASISCSRQKEQLPRERVGNERVLSACTAVSLKDFFHAEKGAASRTEPVERSRGLGHGCVSMGPELEPLFRESGGEMRLPEWGSTETLQSPSPPARRRGAGGVPEGGQEGFGSNCSPQEAKTFKEAVLKQARRGEKVQMGPCRVSSARHGWWWDLGSWGEENVQQR